MIEDKDKDKDKGKVEKTFKTWIVLNYKSGQFRVLKKLGTLKPSEIAIDLSLDVIMPKSAMIVAKGTIELSSAKMASMTLEELEED